MNEVYAPGLVPGTNIRLTQREADLLNNCRYPDDVYTAFSSSTQTDETGKRTGTVTKTLSVASALYPADASKGQNPRGIYDGKFSRYVFTIIKKSSNGRTEDKEAPKANITVDEIPGIVMESEAAAQVEAFLSAPVAGQLARMSKEMKNGFEKLEKGQTALQVGMKNLFYFFVHHEFPKREAASANSAAGQNEDTARLIAVATGTKIAGRFKNRTAVDILREDPGQRDALESQIKWLEGHLNDPKFGKRNGEQIEAIKAAVRLLDMGALDSAAEETTGSKYGDRVILKAEPHPVYRSDQNPVHHSDGSTTGECPVREISITWHYGERYPVEIYVKNYHAPFVRLSDGRINVENSKSTDIVNLNCRLTSKSWFECLHAIQADMRRFEDRTADNQLRDAEDVQKLSRMIAEARKK